MNICNIIIGIVFLGFILVGWFQGMFRVVVSAAGLIASIFVSIYISPYVSGYLQENTKIDDKIAGYIAQELQYSDTGQEVTRGMQIAAINSLPLPETLKATILDNNNSEVYGVLAVSGVYDYIAMSIAVVILNAAVFLALIMVCRFIFWILGRKLKDLTKLPILHSIDKVGGGALGGLKGFLWIWIFFLFLSITSSMEWSRSLIAQISTSPILKYMYDNNFLVDLVGDFTRILFL